ncbi:MAG TPA: ABC transporter substrate-binding protein [Jiangellaceae bacterium]
MRRPRMRALVAGSAATVLLLAACADDDPEAEGTGDTSPDAEATEPSGEPIVVGSTLSLTGAFAATGAIHQVVGEQFVDQLNENGGLLGRPVEWTVLDDESDQAQVTALYERLINQEQVDLIIGPYATPNIISAIAVAERYGYTIPQHTAVLAPLLTYDCQFPAWSIGPEPNVYVPEQLFDALETLPDPPQTIAILTNQNGSTDFVSYGSPDDEDDPGAVSIAQERGLDVVAEVRYPPTTSDWAPIAAQVRDANPDFVLNSGLGVDPVNIIQAMEQLGYRPPLMFSLFPAPGPLLGLGDAAQGLLSVSIFEANDAALEEAGPEATAIVEEYEARATAAGLPYTAFETQATASWNAWEILVGGAEGAGDVDHQGICDYLHENGADTTFSGHLEFDPEVNNFWPSTQGLKQIQGAEWVMVYPEDRAAAELQPPTN